MVADGTIIGEKHYGSDRVLTKNIRYTFDENGSICGYSTSTDGSTWTDYYFITNLQGDVLRVFRESDGAVVAAYTYDSWGNILRATGELAEENPLRYRGYYYDEETGFYYVSSRYYDPEIGRFINADEMMDTASALGFNLFAYCENNPIIYVDPTGYGKTYVIYYNNPERGFYKQAMNSPYYNIKSNDVHMIGVISNQNFIDAWNSMSGTIDYVYLYLHGGQGVLYFKDESLRFSGEQSFSDLDGKKVQRKVYLFSCSGGSGKEGNNVAWMLAKLTNSKVYACTGGVSYTKVRGKYYARKTFYYQKRYIFWGNAVAKSSAGQW